MSIVIKKRLIGIGTPKPSTFNMSDIEAEAEGILAEARAELARARSEADQIAAEANSQGQRLRKEAHEEGYSEGKKQGLSDGMAEGTKAGSERALTEARADFAEQTAELRKSLESLLTQFDRKRHETFNEAHHDVLAFSLAIAEKIVRRHIAYDSDAVLSLVKSALNLVTSRTAITVRMNGDDLEKLNLLDAKEAEKLSSYDDVTFASDETVERGGCIVATACGEIDAQISTQIDAIVSHIVPGKAEKIRAWQKSAETDEQDEKTEDNAKKQ